MYLAFNAPRSTTISSIFFGSLPFGKIPLPENWLPEYPYKDAIGSSKTLRDEALAPFPRTPFAIKTHIKEYYAIISHLEANWSNFLKALEASERHNNTTSFLLVIMVCLSGNTDYWESKVCLITVL